jgi:hypothetical protein
MPSRAGKGRLRVLATVGCVLTVAGCAPMGQSSASPEPPVVAYVGNSLLVAGNRYSNDPTASDYVLGNVLVLVRPEKTEVVSRRLTQLGLRSVLHRSVAGDWFLVEVRRGFETQWVAALSGIEGVASTHLNHRIVGS